MSTDKTRAHYEAMAVEASIDALARSMFRAYSSNSGCPPELHRHPNAARQWMAQALTECGVADLIKATKNIQSRVAEGVSPDPEEWDWLDNALARIGSTS